MSTETQRRYAAKNHIHSVRQQMDFSLVWKLVALKNPEQVFLPISTNTFYRSTDMHVFSLIFV